MVTLKEQEAITYLQRASSCIHEEDNFSHLQLLKNMLDIEAAYLSELEIIDPDMAHVTIDSTGFPAIDDWISDMKHALNHFRSIKSRRAKILLPSVEQLVNGQPLKAMKMAEDLEGNLSDTASPLIKLFGKYNRTQRDYFEDYDPDDFISPPEGTGNPDNKEEFPLKLKYAYPAYSGLLLLPHKKTLFQEIDEDTEYPKIVVPDVVGVKFINPGKNGKTGGCYDEVTHKPYIIYASLGSYRGVDQIRTLIPDASLLGRTRFKNEFRNREHNYATKITYIDDKNFHSSRSATLKSEGDELFKYRYRDIFNKENPDRIDQEKYLNGICIPAKTALCSLDVLSIPQEDLLDYISLLPQVGPVLGETNKLLTNLYIAEQPEDFMETYNELLHKQIMLFDKFKNNELRRSFQFMIADSLQGLKRRLEGAKESGEEGLKFITTDPREFKLGYSPRAIAVPDPSVPEKVERKKWLGLF